MPVSWILPLLKKNDFITYSPVSLLSPSILALVYLAPNPTDRMQMGTTDAFALSGLQYRRETLSLRNLNIL